MRNKYYGWKKVLLCTIVVACFTLMLMLNASNNTTYKPHAEKPSESPDNSIYSLNGGNATLDATMNASIYNPGQTMHVWANFTYENGTAIENATVGFLLADSNQTTLANQANETDANGISTWDFLVEDSYYEGNYTMYVTASKGIYNDSKNISIYIDVSTLQIIMDPLYSIADIIYVYANYTFFNGTSIVGATCGFTLRNASGPLHSGGNFTNSSGIAVLSFGISDYGEGYYEMYATATLGNYNASANQTFYISTYVGPFIRTPSITPAPPAYNESGLVNVSIGVSPVYANITGATLSFNNGTGWYNITMTNSTNFSVIGYAYFNASIPAHNWSTQISYKIWSIDSNNNQTWNDNNSNLFNYTVGDRWGPTIYDPTWSTPITYTDTVNVTVHLTEDPASPFLSSGIDTVLLYYHDGLTWNVLSMNLLNGTQSDAYYTTLIPEISYGGNVLFYIWANDSANNPSINDNSGANFSYFVNDFWGPTITSITDNAPIAYNMTANVTCRVQEPTIPANAAGVHTVILIYHNGSTWNNLSMNLYSGDAYDGNYSALIPELAWNTTVRYWIWVNDTAGNPSFDNNSGLAYSYVVSDFWGPTISNITLENPPIAYNVTANLTCRVQEPAPASGVHTVILNYDNGTHWNNLTMIRYNGDVYDGYYYALVPELPYGTTVQGWIWVNDSVDNPSFDDNNSNYYSYFVDDFWGPTLGTIMTNITGTPDPFEVVRVNVTVTEPLIPNNASGVNQVSIFYDNGSGFTSTPMNLISGTTYNGLWEGFIPGQPFGTPVNYTIIAEDNAANPTQSAYYTYRVSETSFIMDLNATVLRPDQDLMVTGTFKFKNGTSIENGICSFFIRNGSGPLQNWGNLTDANGIAKVYFGFNDSYADADYELYGTATFGPVYNNTVYTTFTIQRYSYPLSDDPIFTPSPPGYNQTCLVNTSIWVSTDVGFVDTAILYYLDPSLGWQSTVMTNTTYDALTGDAYYNATIPAYDYGTEIACYIWANDTLGAIGINNNSGLFHNYTVTDYWGPIIYDPSWVTPNTYTNTVNITVRLTEDPAGAGIATVLFYYHDGSTWNVLTMNQLNGTPFDAYYRGIIPEVSYGVDVLFYIWANDTANNPSINDNSGANFSYFVDDFWGPTIYSPAVTNAPIAYNMTANVICRVVEPTVPANAAGVDIVILSYDNGTHWNNLTMSRYFGNVYDGNYSALIPELAYGTLVRYWVWVNDSANNPSFDDNSGSYYSYVVDDLWAPIIGTPGQNDTVIEYTEAVNITVQIIEPLIPASASGVQTVTLSYWNGSGWTNVTIFRINGTNFDGFWSGVIPPYAYGTEVAYQIYARDVAGRETVNDNNGNYFNYTVTDLTAPTINLINPPSQSYIAGDYPFEIADIAPSDTDVVNITIIYSYNTSGWFNHGSFIEGINLTWNVGTTTTVYVNTSGWTLGSNYTFYAIAQDLRGLVSTPSFIYNITVSNYTGPFVRNIFHTPDPPAYNESATISCDVQVPESFGNISTVILSYDNGTGWVSLGMSNSTPILPGEAVTYVAPIPKFDWATQVLYWIFANDTNGNSTFADNFGSYYSYIVTDRWAPTIENVTLKSENGDVYLEYWEIIYLDSVDLSEPYEASGIALSDAAILSYSLDQLSWTNLSLEWKEGDGFYMVYRTNLGDVFLHLNVIPPHDFNTTIYYKVYAVDLEGNWGNSSVQSFEMEDKTAPILTNLTEITVVNYSDTMRIDVNANETTGNYANATWYYLNGSGINTIYLNYTVNGWVTFDTINMILDVGNIYNGSWYAIIPRQNYSSTVQYQIWATDLANNVRISDTKSYYVNDTTALDTTLYAPVLDPLQPQYFDSTNISIRISVPYVPINITNAAPISSVSIYYQNLSGWTGPSPMSLSSGTSYDGIWSFIISPHPYGVHINYTIEVIDAAGNKVNSSIYLYNTSDLLPPQFGNSTEATEYWETATIRVIVFDVPLGQANTSSGIDAVLLNWTNDSWGSFNIVEMVRISGNQWYGQYEGSISPQDYGLTIEYYFWANDTAGNQNDTRSAPKSYIIEDHIDPVIIGWTLNDNAPYINYNDTVNVTIFVGEDTTPALASGIDTVLLNYTANGITWNIENMTFISGDILSGRYFNSSWYTLIGAFNYCTWIDYYFIVNDTAGNGVNNSVANLNFHVTDRYSPNIISIQLNDSNVMYYEAVNITVHVTEPLPPASPANASGVAVVTLMYNDSIGWHSIVMNRVGGNRYDGNYSAVIPPQAYGYVYYQINATDYARNSNITVISPTYRYLSNDDIDPQIGAPIQSPISSNVNYNDSVTVRVNVTEPAAASQVDFVLIQYFNGTHWINATTINTINNEWQAIISADFPYGFEVAYQIYAIDNALNSIYNNNTGNFFNYTIIDEYVPLAGYPTIDPPAPQAGQLVNVTIQIWEPTLASGVNTVLICYWRYDTPPTNITLPINYTMVPLGNDIYSYIIPGVLSLTTVEYFFYANDSAGNWLRWDKNGENWSYFVPDLFYPSINNVTYYPIPPQYNQSVVVSVHCNDTQSGIASVAVNYMINNNLTWFTEYAAPWVGDYWNATLGLFQYGDQVAMYVAVTDGAGRVSVDNNTNQYYNFTVTDSYPPSIGVHSVNDPFINYNETVSIHVNVVEPTIASGVAFVNVSYNYGVGWINISMNLLNGTIYNGFWNATIPALDYGSNVSFYFIAEDNAGSIGNNYGSRDFYLVRDQYAPGLAGFTRDPFIVNYNDTANITIIVTEPTTPASAAGAQQVFLNYSVNGIWQTPISMSLLSGDNWTGTWMGLIPVQNYSDIVEYYIIANDNAGNPIDNYLSRAQYIVNDTYAPEIVAIYLNDTINNINYDEWVNITVRIEEPSTPTLAVGIDTVLMNYSTDGGLTWNIPVTMTYIDGVIIESQTYVGYYYAIVDPQNYSQVIKYFFIVNDTLGNVRDNLAADLQYSVVDNHTSSIGAYSTNDNFINYNETVSIHVRITEPTTPAFASGVEFVNLSYNIGAGWIDLPMNQLNGTIWDGYWNATIPSADYGTTVQFYFIVWDFAGNRIDDSASVHQYTVIDQYPPQIVSVLVNGTNIGIASIPYNESANITVVITEPTEASGVFGANLSYSINGVSWITVAMQFLSGNGYTNSYFFIIPPQQWNASHYLIIDIADNASNVAQYNYQYNITDPDNPLVTGVIPSTTTPEYDELVVVNVTVTEPLNASGVNLVLLQYRNSSESQWHNVTMTPIGINLYQGSVYWYSYNSTVFYQILAYDHFGNMGFNNNTGLLYNHTVEDYTDPIISSPITTPPAPFIPTRINVTVIEPENASGVLRVILYWRNNSIYYQIQMSSFYGNDIWNATVPAQISGVIHYYINATDVANNTRISIEYLFVIGDILPPSLDNVIFPVSVEYATPFNITIIATDQSGVSAIVIGWWVTFIPSVIDTEIHYINTYYIEPGDQYIFTIPGQKYYDPDGIPPHELFFRIYNITDGASNTLYPIYQQKINVIDLIQPVIGIPIAISPYQNEAGTHSIEVTVNITEPALASGVGNVWFSYYNTTLGSGNWRFILTYTQVGDTFIFSIPNQSPTENVTYIIFAQDSNHITYGGPNGIGTSQRTFTVGLQAERLALDTTMITLRDLAGNPLVNVSIDAWIPFSLDIIPYSTPGGGASNPDYLIISGFFEILINISAPNIRNITVIIYYSQSIIDALGVDESTAVMGIFNVSGYVEQLVNTSVNTDENYVVLTNLPHLSHFVLLAKMPVVQPPFPNWIIYVIIIGAVAGIAVVVMSRRKKEVPVDVITKKVINLGHVHIEELAKEYHMENSEIIQIINSAIDQNQLRGFFTIKKKEFITMDQLKEELNKRLEGD